MTTVMTENPETAPAEERRGGADPDWDQARPGQPLPRKPAPENDDDDGWAYDRDAAPLWHACGHPACGGT